MGTVIKQTVKTQMECCTIRHFIRVCSVSKDQNTNFSNIMHHYLDNSNCDPFKYTMGSPMPVASIDMGKSIRIQGVKRKRNCQKSYYFQIVFV